MTAQYQLNAKAILDKQFNVDLKGYAPREVDEFLDKVIADYQTYDETIRELGESLRNYENQVEQLKAKIAELEAKVGAEGETMPPQSQVVTLGVASYSLPQRMQRAHLTCFMGFNLHFDKTGRGDGPARLAYVPVFELTGI